MSQNFAVLQKAIQTSPQTLGATRLLSISLDPEFDAPVVLKQYAQNAGADFDVWTFGTGNPAEIHRLTTNFSVYVQPEAGTTSHSLATALIDGDGKIAKIWRGNGWTPGEVIEALAH